VKLALVTDDSVFENKIRHACALISDVDLVRVSLNDLPDDPAFTLAELVSAGGRMIAMGPGAPLPYVMELADRCGLEHPEISVMLVEEPTDGLFARAMRSGVRDIIDPSDDTEELVKVLRRLVASAESLRRNLAVDEPEEEDLSRGRVQVFTSPKGGTGKTTLATNVAVALAHQHPGKVALVDLDLLFGDVAIGLRLQPNHTIHSVTWNEGSLDGEAARLFLTEHRSGLSVLAAPASLVEGEQVPAERLGEVLEMLAGQFDHLVVDTAPGLDEATLAALEVADDQVVIGTAALQSFVAVRRFCEGLKGVESMDATTGLVLNRWPGRRGVPIAEVESAIGHKVRAVIPEAREVLMATEQGSVLLDSAPRCDAAVAIQELATILSPTAAESTNDGTSHKRRWGW